MYGWTDSLQSSLDKTAERVGDSEHILLLIGRRLVTGAELWICAWSGAAVSQAPTQHAGKLP